MQLQQQPTEQADTVDLMVNMGPQHPSTHGVFRLVLWIDGERVTRAEPHIGYLHRGSEKLCEGEQYSQIITLFDRLDYISNLNCELAFCLAVEKLMGLEVPDRASYIRVILCELNRIASHMLFYGVYGLDVGAMTPILYGFRERERIQSLFESVTGARMMHNYIRVGGVKEDLPEDFADRLAGLTAQLRAGIDECDELLTNNEMFLARTKGIGSISGPDGIDFGLTGPALRAAGGTGRRQGFRTVLYLRPLRLWHTGRDSRRLLGPVLRENRGDAAVAQDSGPGHEADGARAHLGEGPKDRPATEGRGVSADRIAARRLWRVPRERRERQAVPGQGQGALLCQPSGS